MAVSNKFSRTRRSGVVVTSTIALALGGAAIVAPSTAAAESVRYTDTQEPVEPKKSELNSTVLTCGVQLTDTVSSNSGLSYERRVPNKANPTDPIFGIQVTANTSGERTFNFLNVADGPNNPPISSRTVTLPPLQPGDTIGPPATGTVNYVQDVPNMVIDPPVRGATAREFRTEMDLTKGQVDQIAGDGMTVGWKGQYNAGMTSKNDFFFSDSGEFYVNGVVNPWPSENADCSPITIDWADELDTAKYEGTVIQPGSTVKVGAVSADKDSLERLRFTAKDPKGNEVPGEITREGNDIYWTMANYIEGQPAYTQTDKLTFEMIAMPRDLEGLKTAAAENGSLPETVYDSSLAPERYRSPETIATKTFDIDDAKNHDPNYDSRQQNITSGVANNAPTEGRQTRTFTNVADSNGDTLADLVEKYNARIELDDSNVYEGWDAYFRDPDNGDYTVVVESPEGVEARPGSFGQPVVKVTYSNGTQDIIPLLVIVDPNNTQTTDVVYPPETIRGIIGEEMTSEAPTLKRVIGKNQPPVKPASYAVDPATVPAGWTIEVASDGTVTATSPEDATAGDMARPQITATYPDGTVDEREVTFLVGDDASLNNPSYPVEVTKPSAPVTHQIQNAPEGATFTLDNDEVDGWTYSIDPKTGAVTVTPPANAQGGNRKANTVTVTYPDGTTDVVPVDTVVAYSMSYETEPHYPEETRYPGETVTSTLTVDKPAGVDFAPDNPFAIVPGANFTATGENNAFGNPTYTVSTANGEWTVSLDNDGNVISEIPETAKNGDRVSVPVRVTYEDRSYDDPTAVITVQDNPTRQVPFGVEYVYDDTIPAGQYKVVTKGVAGEEKQQRDGTWKRTAEPKNEVVRVGTKPATASKDVTWTAPIPYSTTTRPNPELAPGETKVVQQGVDGERTYTAKFTATGDQASVVESEDTKQPIEEIIEYGPRLDDQELVTETTRKIPFDTQIIPDDTLAAGTQVVDKQGVVGEETVTSKQKLVDGKPAGDPVVETTTVTQKQDAVIRVGTKTEGTNTFEYTEPVPYGTKVEYDPTLAAGEYQVVTPGKAGEKTLKVTQTVVNSKVTDTQREATVTEPTTEVIKVGTKQATATSTVEWKEPIPFSTVVRQNPELKPGEVKVVQQGKDGQASYKATFEGTNGTAKVVEVDARTEPTEQIVEYGPTIADQTLTTTTTNPVPFNTTFVADPNLPVGEQVVDKQGENGVDTVTATQEIKDGKPVGKPKMTTERTKEPVDAVVRVGTKTEGQTVNTYEAEIPFPVRVVYDPNLAPGESKVTQEGKPGIKKVTITQPVVNSAPNGEATVAEETVTEPTEQIVTVGTKPDEATNTATWTAQVPFKTVVRPNTELKPGEVKTVQEGEYGEKTYTADFSSVGSDSKVETREEQTKAPKDQIIEYGPTIDDQTLTSTTTRPIEFETEFLLDDTLPAGEQKVDQQGENGEEKITSTQEIKDGKPVGEPTITTEVTKPAKNAIIRIGTKPETTTATTTSTTTATTTVPTTVKETEKVTETQTVTVTSVAPQATTTVTETKEVPVKTMVPTTVTNTSTVAQVTVTSNVTTTEKSTATETTTATATVVNDKAPEVRVNGSTIEYWQTKGESIAIAIRDENVKGDTLKFRPIDGGQLSSDGRTLTLPGKGVYTVNDQGSVAFTPVEDVSGDVPAVKIDYVRTDGAKVVTPIQVIGHYNDCGCKVTPPKSSDPASSSKESSNPKTTTSNPKTTTSKPSEPSNPSQPSNPANPSQPSNPANPSQPGESSTPKSPTSSAPTSESKPSATVTTTVDGKVTTTVVPATTVVTTINGTPTTVTTPVAPAATTTSGKPTGGLSTVATPTAIPTQTPDAATVVDRCVQNAVRSPLLYLIPLGLLGYALNEVAGPVIQQATAPYQDALNRINGELNARANEIARQYLPDDQFGLGRAGDEFNRRLWENQDFARIANQVNDINAQAQRLAAQYQPQLRQLGEAAGVILAVTAAGAVMYDWCSNEPGQAWTAIGTDQWSNLANRNQGQ